MRYQVWPRQTISPVRLVMYNRTCHQFASHAAPLYWVLNDRGPSAMKYCARVMLNPMTRARGMVSLQYLWRCNSIPWWESWRLWSPDVSQDVEHDQVEPFPLQFNESQVGHEKATHEEKCVDIVITIGDDLVAIHWCVASLYLKRFLLVQILFRDWKWQNKWRALTS